MAEKVTITDRLVRNQSERPDGAVIDAIVLHGTGSLNVWGTLGWFDDPRSQASAHYVVDVEGDTYRCVPDDRKAWHAGISRLWGLPNVNDFSIGVELVHANDDAPYPEEQRAALMDLLVMLCSEYHAITLNRIVGHAAVAPGRKVDPVGFPWRAALIELGARLSVRA